MKKHVDVFTGMIYGYGEYDLPNNIKKLVYAMDLEALKSHMIKRHGDILKTNLI